MKEALKDFLKKKLTPKQIKIIRGLWEFALTRPFGDNLIMLGRIYETDKGDENHSFMGLSNLHIYEKYLSPLRHRPVKLLEIGVLRGESVRMWKRYFSGGQIYGIDIDPDAKQFEEPRISIEIGSQTDEVVMARVVARAGEFDIILDDGSHVNKHMIKSFNYLFSKLKKGGFYIIEDLGCSYALLDKNGVRQNWPGMKYNPSNDNLDNDRKDMDEFFKNIIHDMDHRQGHVISIQFWSHVCVIVKG